MTKQLVTISRDPLGTRFYCLRLPHPEVGVRNTSVSAEGTEILVTREELHALEEQIRAWRSEDPEARKARASDTESKARASDTESKARASDTDECEVSGE